MTKNLFKSIVFSFLASVVMTGIVYALWLNGQESGSEEMQVLTVLMLVGCIFQNLLLFITSLPALLVVRTRAIKNNGVLPFVLAGPILTTLFFVLFYGGGANGALLFITPGLFFTLAYVFLHSNWVKAHWLSSLKG